MRRLALVVSLLLVSCGPPGTVAPTAATANDLVGWWVNEDPATGERRTWGFVEPPNGPWSVPVPFTVREQPISTLYSGGSPRIRSTFEVKNGEILETVVDSVDFDPGKQFSTKLVSLVKQKSMTLASSTAVGGERTYTWHERCPTVLASGWSNVITLNYPSYFATASTMAFDSKGRLHTFTGMAGAQDGRFPARPTYSVLDRGCEAVWFTASNARQAALLVDGSDVVHLFWTESAIYSEGTDSTLMHKYRHTDAENWTTEVLSSVQSNRVLRPVSRGNRTVLVTQRDSGDAMYRSIELFEARDGAWQSTFATVGGVNVLGGLNGAGIDLEGRLWISLSDTTRGSLLRELSAGVFERLPTPDAPLALVGDFYVDGAGRAHQFITRGPNGTQHGILENSAWRFLPAASGEGFVPVDAPPWKYFVVADYPFPFLVLATQQDDGPSTYEFINGRFYNPGSWTTRGVALARDGTIAVAETGETVTVKRPVAPWGQVKTTSVTLTFGGTGSGRVRSEDGRIDCTATCTLELPRFSRYRLRIEAAPQNTILRGASEIDAQGIGTGWLDVSHDGNDVMGTSTTNLFEFGRSVTPQVIPMGPPTGSLGTITQWDARGTSFAISSTTTAGKVYFRDAEYSAPDAGAGEVLLLAEGASTPVVTRLPATPVKVGVLNEGGVRALFFANRALTFDGTTLGASTAPVVAHVTWSSSLAQTAVQTLMTLPANSLITASALDPVGNAAVLVENGTGFPSLGANVNTALVWRSSSGLVMIVPFAANELVPQPRLTLRGATLFLTSQQKFWVFADGVSAGSRTILGADVGFGSPSSTGVQALVTATSGGIDFGSGSLNPAPGDQYVVSWGFDGSHTMNTRQQPSFTRVLAAGATARGLLVLEAPTAGPPYLMLAGQNVGEPLVKTQVRVMSQQLDGEGFWVLLQQQTASVDYGTAVVPGAGRLVLVKGVLP